MPRALRTSLLILATIPFLLAVACSATHTVVLKGDGSGTMAMHLEVSKLLHDYVAGLAEVSGGSGASRGDAIFDLAAIRRGFEAQQGITVESVSSPEPRSLDVRLAFVPLPDLFEHRTGLQSANALSFSVADGLATLRIHLDRANYRQIAGFFPMLESPILQSLGPQVDQTITEDDYLEMIRFSLGDDGPALVRKSSLTIRIRPQGDIVSQTGGTVSGDAVEFRIPLLRLLLLDRPLDFSLSFRPRESDLPQR